MKYDPNTLSLAFSSQDELDEFHSELVGLLRCAMITATRRIPDSQEAKSVSREVIKDNHVVMSALNQVRRTMQRKAF